MKDFLKTRIVPLFGIMLVAVMGFTFVACDDGSGSPPSIPTGITATATSSSSITIRWSPVADATSYSVYRSTSSSGTFSSVGTSSTTSYTDTGLSTGTTYYYRVTAQNNNGESLQSSTVSVTTLSPPGTPTEVTATVTSSTSITISWVAVADATSYSVYRSTNSSGAFTSVGTSDTISYTDTGLSTGITYYYRVTARNSDGESSPSITVSATSLFPPSVPTEVTATAASSTSITISWAAVADATSYSVYRSTSSSGTFTSVGTRSTTSYTNTGLTASTTYYYQVTARNNDGESSPSDTVSATTLTPPSAPMEVTVTAASSTSITISWAAVSDATSYSVYRSDSLSSIGTSSTTSYTDTGLTSNTTYYYQVTARDSNGESSRSSTVSATTSAPEFPSGFIRTWRRSTYTMTLTFTSTTLRASNQTYYWTVENVSGDAYTITSSLSGTRTTITIRLVNGELIISGDSGTGQSNWNGTWTTTSIIDLAYGSWYSNTLSAGQTHYYRFYATAGTYRVEWQDSDNSSYTADVVASVRREDSSSYYVQRTDSGSGSLNISTSGYIIIEIEGYNSSSSGTYRIRYY